jgi:hypothetical protein
MKRLLAVGAFVLGLAASTNAQVPVRTLTYYGCDVWGCVTVQLRGSLTYGLSMFNLSDREWFYRGLLSASEAAPAELTLRTDGWTFNDVVGAEESLHRFAGNWGENYVELADFSTDFIAPSVSGHIDSCADPGRILCNAGYTDYGAARLNLVSVTTTPEPATLLSVAVGLLGIAASERHRRSRRGRV